MKTQEEERLWDKKIIVPTSAEISQAKICAEEINKAHGGEHLRNSFTEGEQTALGLLAEIVLENNIPCLERQERLEDAVHHDMINTITGMLMELKSKATVVPTVPKYMGSIAKSSLVRQHAEVYGMSRAIFPKTARLKKRCSISPKGWRYEYDINKIERIEYLGIISKSRLEKLKNLSKPFSVNGQEIIAPRCRMIEKGQLDPVAPAGPSNWSQLKFEYDELQPFSHSHWQLDIESSPCPFDLSK